MNIKQSLTYINTLLLLLCVGCGPRNITKSLVEDYSSTYFGKNEQYKFVRILKDQTVDELAREHQVPVKEITRINSLKSYSNIRIGTIVKIPTGNYHIVETEDTLESIARVYDVNLDILAEANGLKSTSSVRTGDYILIPETDEQYNDMSYDDLQKQGRAKIIPINSTAINKKEQKQWMLKNENPLHSKEFIWPIKGEVIKKYGYYNGKLHLGINIKAKKGVPVRAASGGRVVYVSTLDDHGNLIIIKHKNGYMTAYSHLDCFLVKKGQVVNKGAHIGTVGQTGYVNEPQLQFSIRKGSNTIDPDK